MWSGGRRGTAVLPKQLKKRPQVFGIQNDVSTSTVLFRIFRTERRGLLREPTGNPRLNVMILSHVSFLSDTVRGLTGD